MILLLAFVLGFVAGIAFVVGTWALLVWRYRGGPQG